MFPIPSAMPEGDSPTPLQTGTRAPTPAEVRQWLQENDVSRFQLAQDLATQLAAANRRAAEAETKQAPAGAVVLTGDDAKAWDAYKALGKPDELGTLKSERDTLKGTIAERDATDKRLSAAEQAADALGWNAKALRTFAADKKLTLEMRETDVDDGKGGKTKKSMPFLLSGEGATATAEPLSDVITRDHDVYLPALTARAQVTTPTTPAPSRFPVTPAAPANGGAGTSEKERAAELRASGHYAF